jgi:hypothetical protein
LNDNDKVVLRLNTSTIPVRVRRNSVALPELDRDVDSTLSPLTTVLVTDEPPWNSDSPHLIGKFADNVTVQLAGPFSAY